MRIWSRRVRTGLEVLIKTSSHESGDAASYAG